jgi:hypothetical protein
VVRASERWSERLWWSQLRAKILPIYPKLVERGSLNFERSKIWVWEDDGFRGQWSGRPKSGLNGHGRPKW